MASESGATASLSLGDFLVAEEPVWVWDASARRILWANPAGRIFWGATTLEDLRARRFSPRSKAIQRLSALASLAGQGEAGREWLETLSLSSASGRKAVKCYVQSLEVAGGRPGLIVKALDEPVTASRESPPGTGGRPAPDKGPARSGKSDEAALDAIARRLNHRRRSAPRAVRPAPFDPSPFDEAAPARLPDSLMLQIREFCHELRNPLTVIMGFAERLKDSAHSPKRREQWPSYAGNIWESAQLAMAILSDFSESVLNAQAAPRRPEPADIRAAVESSLRLIGPLAKQGQIKLSRRVQGGLPAFAAGDKVLKQILLNLLMNAVRHQKTGGRIRVTGGRRKDGSVKLSVSDNGQGMTKKELKAVMRAARQGTPPPPRPGRSGLGLPLVMKLVESAGGTLSIESERSKGTTVEMIFPDFG